MKRFNMKNICIAASAALFFAACGDNVTDNSPVATQAYANQDAFPECDKGYEGMFATITSSKELYICTAEKWVNLSKGGAEGKSASKSGCRAKELEDESGVEITCNGEVVGTLNYGKTGAKGSDGGTGDKGDKGGKGSDGSSFSGSTPTWDTDRCKLKNSGFDYMIEAVEKVKEALRRYERLYQGLSFLRCWKVSGKKEALRRYREHWEEKRIREEICRANALSEEEKARFTFMDDADFSKFKTLEIEATAKVSVTTAQTVSAQNYRPFVGVGVTLSSEDMGGRLGLCVTYSSPKDMGLLLKGNTGYLRATLPASDTDTMVNVLWSDFAPVAEGVNPDKVIREVSAVYVEAVSGDSVGEYENTFTLAQLGDYGLCDSVTFNIWKPQVEALSSPGEDLVAGGITYKTVKIGDQTWMAENLRSGSNDCLLSTDDANCSLGGRKYTWLQALGSDATTYGCSSTTACTTELPQEVQGICPTGWHLPNIHEWGKPVALLRAISNNYASDVFAFYKAGGNYTNENITMNLTGLGLVYESSNTNGNYWSSTEDTSKYSQARTLDNDDDDNNGAPYVWNAPQNPDDYNGYYKTKTTALPVRCIKDAPAATP